MTRDWLRASNRLSGAWALLCHSSFLILLLIVVLAAYLRLYNLLPLERGLQFLQDYDEAVWDTTAQLMLQGYLPYRDFFATLPPVGIYLLAGVLRLVNVPWGSGVSLMATRYASVFYGLATIAMVYLVGRKLAGQSVGLAAAGLLALDGMVIGMDRRAMLEPPLNLFSILAVLAYWFVFERAQDDARGQWMAALAGSLSAFAALVKTPGLVVLFALLTVSLLRRRLREALIIAISFGLSWVALSCYFLLQCPDDFLKQVYFFQLLRPADGIVRRISRLYDIWHYAQAWLTVRTGLIGALFLGLLSIKQREARPWLAVLFWLGYTLALIVVNSSYWPQYYAQLAVPLSLLGGGLLDARAWPVWPWRSTEGHIHWLTLGALTFLTILLIGLVRGPVVNQYMNIVQMLSQTSPTYTKIADYLNQNSSTEAKVLVFEPNYTFLSSRPPAGAQPGHFIVDSYGQMLYVNLGIQERSLLTLVGAVLTDQKDGLQPMFWRAPAQEQVLAAFAQAQYVIIDGRARYQLQPQTLAAIQARSTEVLATGVASLRKRH